MYNKFRCDQKFKLATESDVLEADLAKRRELHQYKITFTLSKLLESQTAFIAYIQLYGDKEPIQFFRPKVNEYANYFLSFSHFITTNQPYADRINKIINKAKENEEKLPEACAVFNAVVAIKQIYDEMNKGNISGRTKRSISNLLKQFNLNVESKDLEKQMSTIEDTLKYINEFDNKRIISPRVLRI